MDSSKPHAVQFVPPGMGHLIPALELAKCLVTHHCCHVTIIPVTSNHTSTAESQLLKPSSGRNLYDVVEIQPVDISGKVDADATVLIRLTAMMREAVPALRSAISAMKFRPTVLIVDLLGIEALDVADQFAIRKYVYIYSTAWLLTLTIYCNILDKEVEGEYVDQNEPLRLPGCKPVRPEDVFEPMLERKHEQYDEYLSMGVALPKSDGILVNTWEDVEPTTLRALRDHKILKEVVKVPVYPIGPLIRTVEAGGPKSELFDWLDLQPTESVIFVSFGSGGTMSLEQMTELAWGLEQSKQRFIWVVRPPNDKDLSGSFFTAGNEVGDTLWYLPDGFLTRTHKVGLVVSEWAPQLDILNHPSVGGFLSHCGWNSTLESIVNGVPMIAWPLYAEQRMNAAMLSEELGVAVRPKELPSKRVVGREEIKSMVRRIMEDEEGKPMRDRVKKLQYSAEKALSKGGSSYNSLSKVAKDWEINLKSENGSPRQYQSV